MNNILVTKSETRSHEPGRVGRRPDSARLVTVRGSRRSPTVRSAASARSPPHNGVRPNPPHEGRPTLPESPHRGSRLTAAALSIGIALTRRPRRPGRPSTTAPAVGVVDPPRWDIPVRMAVATGVVLAVTAHHIYGAHARHAQSACVTGPCEQPAIRPAVSSRVATRRVTTGRFVSWGGRGPNASSKATHSH
jgi:hypothetical protein